MNIESSVMFDEVNRRNYHEELKVKLSKLKKEYSEASGAKKNDLIIAMDECKKFIPLFSVKDSVVTLTKTDISAISGILSD